jgi:sortase A
LKGFHRHLAPLLLFSGIAVLGYAGFQYGAMFLEQRHLQALWREQQETQRSMSPLSPTAFRQSGLTRITIPSIRFSAVIVEGTDFYSLLIAPGHLTGTAQPGEAGNAVVSAHRDTFFHNIVKLRPGDYILVERSGRTFTYVVEGFRIVKPNESSVVAPTGYSRLTLVTCDPAYYMGPAPHRLVVISRLLATPSTASPRIELSKQSQPRPQVTRVVSKKTTSPSSVE